MKKLLVTGLLMVFLVGCSSVKQEQKTLDMDQVTEYDEDVLKDKKKEQERKKDDGGSFFD